MKNFRKYFGPTRLVMARRLSSGGFFAALTCAALLLQGCTRQAAVVTPTPPATPPAATSQTASVSIQSPTTNMKLTSSAFQENGLIPSQYTCDGQSMSPPLQISDVPAEAKSLALIVNDPDAPAAGGFTHWVVWNIPAQTTSLNENAVPAGAVQGKGGSGKNAWVGPCPPSGVHHYQFMLYALDSMLDIPDSTDKAGLEKALSAHSVAQTTLVGLYQKK